MPEAASHGDEPEPVEGVVLPETIFCGGVAATPCPEGSKCQLDGDYPDAIGKCIPNVGSSTSAVGTGSTAPAGIGNTAPSGVGTTGL